MHANLDTQMCPARQLQLQAWLMSVACPHMLCNVACPQSRRRQLMTAGYNLHLEPAEPRCSSYTQTGGATTTKVISKAPHSSFSALIIHALSWHCCKPKVLNDAGPVWHLSRLEACLANAGQQLQSTLYRLHATSKGMFCTRSKSQRAAEDLAIRLNCHCPIARQHCLCFLRKHFGVFSPAICIV